MIAVILAHWKTAGLLGIAAAVGLLVWFQHEEIQQLTAENRSQAGELAVARTNVESLQAGIRAANNAAQAARDEADRRLAQSQAAVALLRAKPTEAAKVDRAVAAVPATKDECKDAEGILDAFAQVEQRK